MFTAWWRILQSKSVIAVFESFDSFAIFFGCLRSPIPKFANDASSIYQVVNFASSMTDSC